VWPALLLLLPALMQVWPACAVAAAVVLRLLLSVLLKQPLPERLQQGPLGQLLLAPLLLGCYGYSALLLCQLLQRALP
jgi:hypothetical protein